MFYRSGRYFLISPLFMKRLLPLLLLLSTSLVAMAQDSTLSEAQRDYMAGRIDEARLKFEIVLNRDPKNTTARNYLKMIQAAEKKAGPGRKKEANYRALVIPKVQFVEAPLQDCLSYLNKRVSELTNGEVRPNFVLQPTVNGAALVTLKMENVPFTEVLRYLGQLSGTQFVFEEFAISVRPREGGGTGSTPSSGGSSGASSSASVTTQ